MRLIDADALPVCKEHCIDECGFGANFYVVHKTDIDAAPTITIEAEPVKYGSWKTANDGTHFCSHCGFDAPYAWDDVNSNYINSADDVPDRPSNYCLNCGAKMGLEEN